MIFKCLITITLLYYFILWRVLAKKAAFKKEAREVFGTATGIEELKAAGSLLLKQQNAATLDTSITNTSESIFGPVTNIPSLTRNNMIKSTTLATPLLTAMSPLQKQPKQEEKVSEEQLRHQIFAGSSLAKQDAIVNPAANNIAVKNEVTRLKEQVLSKELADIVHMLDEEESEDVEQTTTPSTIHLPDNGIIIPLENSLLANQLHKLFEKDY